MDGVGDFLGRHVARQICQVQIPGSEGRCGTTAAELEKLAAVEDFCPPLSLGEALGVADQIRLAAWVDREYWPGVIEQLCKQVAARDALLRGVKEAADRCENAERRLIVVSAPLFQAIGELLEGE